MAIFVKVIELMANDCIIERHLPDIDSLSDVRTDRCRFVRTVIRYPINSILRNFIK